MTLPPISPAAPVTLPPISPAAPVTLPSASLPPAAARPAAPATPAIPAAPAALAPPERPGLSIVEFPSTVISPDVPAPMAALRFAFTVAASHGCCDPPGSKTEASAPSGWLPASAKPAASAAEGESNQTSAFVCSYPWESGRWYFIESTLPLMG